VPGYVGSPGLLSIREASAHTTLIRWLGGAGN
jgi:hypothetical protein